MLQQTSRIMVPFTAIALVLGFCVGVSFSADNNVCPTFKDYYTIKNNSRCWYDLSAEYTAPDIIRLNGYHLIQYRVLTDDGYILNLFRIPSDFKNNPHAKNYPVYLQHGLVATCANFLGLGKNSLAFVLADAGYDVWLGNYRGTQFSEEHVNLTVFDQKYWEHSMDEIAAFDLPAIFRTILQETGPSSRIIYVGHSLGSTLALMYAAEVPDVANKIMKLFVFMSPAYTLGNIMSPYKVAAPYGSFIIEIIPVYFNQLPGGTALKVLNHAADLVLGNFRKYDYLEKNVHHYGTLTPPIYDITNIHVPTYLIYSTQDWATTETDSFNLYYNLPKDARFGIRRINLDKFNHMDFVFGRHARKIVYDDLIQVLNKAIQS